MLDKNSNKTLMLAAQKSCFLIEQKSLHSNNRNTSCHVNLKNIYLLYFAHFSTHQQEMC